MEIPTAFLYMHGMDNWLPFDILIFKLATLYFPMTTTIIIDYIDIYKDQSTIKCITVLKGFK